MTQLPDLVPHPPLTGLVGYIFEDLGDELADETHLLRLHPPGGYRRRPDADAAGHCRFLRIKRNGILVYRDPGLLQRRLGHLAGQPLGPKIHQQQMGIRPSRDQAKAEGAKLLGQRDRVQLDLALVRAELVTQGLLEGDRLGGDDVHQGAALEAGKEVLVEDRRVLLLTHDHPPPGAPKRFVRGARDKLGVRDRRGVQFRGDEAGGVRDVGHENRSDRRRDLFEGGEIEGPRVRTAADHDHLRSVLPGQPLHLREVDLLGLGMDAVGNDAEEAARKIHRAAVGQMPPVRQIEPHDRIPRLQDREVDRHVGLGPGVGLDIDMRCAEERLGPLDGQDLYPIDELAAAVVPPARVPLGVLIGHDGARRLHHRLAHEVL